MANDTVNTLAQLNQLFQTLTISLLGITFSNNADKTPYGKVRVSWPTEGQPAWKITEDVCFIRSLEIDNPYNKQRDVYFTTNYTGNNNAVDANNCNQKTSFTRVLMVTWVFYGPSSFENAQKVRDGMFYQLNHDALANNNIYLLPNTESPRRAPELFQGQWWERTDLTMYFNELVIRNLAVPYLKSAQITIMRDNNRANEIVDVTEAIYNATK